MAQENDTLHSEALKRFAISEEGWKPVIQDYVEDVKFSIGDQWPELMRRKREQEERPCLTINKMPQYVHQIVNPARQNKSSLKIYPVDDKADVDTAKILQGLVRHIEYNSNADVAYETALDRSARGGLGWFRIYTDYVSPMSFDQEIMVGRIRDSAVVYPDPTFKELDGSDMNYCTILNSISDSDFEAKYGKEELESVQEWKKTGQNSDWFDKDSLLIAEQFYKEKERKTIVLLENGDVIEKSRIKGMVNAMAIKAERETLIDTVKWCILTGNKVLEKGVWPGRWIPIIPVLGEEVDVEGKLTLAGVIRFSKDSQMMLNFFKSQEAETIALSPKAPYVAAEGQTEPYTEDWENANRENLSVLKYKPVTIGDQLAPPPQRNAVEAPVQAVTQASVYANEDLKSTTGIYDASVGARSNEKSGLAIERRDMQAQTSNFHFADNLNVSRRHGGRIIIDLIPKIYDAPRAARIIGEDDQVEIIRLNEEFQYNGETKIFNVGVGQYDVIVDTGPSFANRRQEAISLMLDFIKINPGIALALGDLIVKNMDFKDSAEIAARLRKLQPPALQDDSKKDIPPEVQAQMTQMAQVIEQLTAKLYESTQVITTKSLELESKERIEFAKIEKDYQIELLKANDQTAMAQIQAQIIELNQRLAMVGMNEPIPFTDFSESGPEQAVIPQNQPTGGLTPGLPMETP